MSQAGAISTSPLMRAASPGDFGQQGPQQKKGDVAAHARPDEHLRPLAELTEDGARLLQPAADGALLEAPLGLAMPRIVEPQAGAPLVPGPIGHRRRLGTGHLRLEAAQPDETGLAAAGRSLAQIGDAATPSAGSNVEELRFDGLAGHCYALTMFGPAMPSLSQTLRVSTSSFAFAANAP